MAVQWINSETQKNFVEFILLAKDEESFREDKKVLRRSDYHKFKFFSSGLQALKYGLDQKEKNADYSCLFIGQEEFADLEIFSFLSLIDLNPMGNLFNCIVLALETNPNHLALLEKQKENYESLSRHKILQRPLTPKMISDAILEAYANYEIENKKYLNSLALMGKSEYDAELNNEKQIIFDLTFSKYIYTSPQKMDFEEAYQEGNTKLSYKLYLQAIEYFKFTSSLDSKYRGKSLFKLFYIFSIKNDQKNAKDYFNQVCQYYIEQNKWKSVEEIIKISIEKSNFNPHPIYKLLLSQIALDNDFDILNMIELAIKYFSSEEIVKNIVSICHNDIIPIKLDNILKNFPDLYSKIIKQNEINKIQKNIENKYQNEFNNKQNAKVKERSNGIQISSAKNKNIGKNIDELFYYNDVENDKENVSKNENIMGSKIITEKTSPINLARKENKAVIDEILPELQAENKKSSFFREVIYIIKKVIKESK